MRVHELAKKLGITSKEALAGLQDAGVEVKSIHSSVNEEDAARLSGGAKKTANEIRDYYYTTWKPPSPDWDVLKVRVAKGKAISITATVNNKTLTKAIMERSRMEQMEIARLACPAGNAEGWKAGKKEQLVGISLSGEAGHIINALCKHPSPAGG